MHKCSGQGCRGCAREAAQVIERDGSEGVETAGRILAHAGLGNVDTARGMSAAQTARNIRETYPGIEVTGEETKEELMAVIESHQEEQILKHLTLELRRKVRDARALLKRLKLKA